jgi:hypothetical protein
MYLTLSIFLSTLPFISSHILPLRDTSSDNTCGTTGSGGSPSSFTCPSDLPCCSVNGWCGSTDAYCLASNGCQAPFGSCNTTAISTGNETQSTSSGGECGPGVGNCGATECCSLAGFCGNGPGILPPLFFI